MPENFSLHFKKYNVIHPKEIKGHSLVAEKLLARVFLASVSLGSIVALAGLNCCSEMHHIPRASCYTSDAQYLRLYFFFSLTVQKYLTL